MDASKLEAFYVYRSLHSDESWGAILACSYIYALPNIDFGILVQAINEKQAIANAKELYKKIHKYDEDKNNVKEFIPVALEYIRATGTHGKWEDNFKSAVNMAVEMNNEFKRHFDAVEAREAELVKDIANNERASWEREINLCSPSDYEESRDRRSTG